METISPMFLHKYNKKIIFFLDFGHWQLSMSDWKGKTKILKDFTIILKTKNTGLTFFQPKLFVNFLLRFDYLCFSNRRSIWYI
jgi:hypothetical protein